jgi:hypothetical protein
MIKTLAFVLSACLAGCAGQAEVRYSGATDPELVTMDSDPSVMIVANADEPVFYSDNSYWLFRDRQWYRSSTHRGGWARVEQPPEHVRRIERPETYVHFRHARETPRTTANEHERPVAPARPEIREPEPRRDQTPPGPTREPNPEGPVRPYANPLPPQQVPPVSPRPDERSDHPNADRAPSPPDVRARDENRRDENRRDENRRDENRDFGR